MNRSPSTIIDFKNPQEVWYDTSFDYSSLCIYGCIAYAHVNDGKLESKAIKCIFLSYIVGVKGYRLWCTENDRTPRFIISRYVTFDESAMFGKKNELDESIGKIDRGVDQKVKFEIENSNKMLEKHETQPIDVQDDDSQSIATRRQKRGNIKSVRYANYLSAANSNPIAYFLAVGESIDSNEPRSYNEAVKNKEAT